MKEGMIYLLAVVLVGIFLLVQSIRGKRRQTLQIRETINKNYGTRPERRYEAKEMENIAKYFVLTKNQDSYIDDITWNDLGMDHIFQRMNHTYSSIGEECLYKRLREPAQEEQELRRFNSYVEFFSSHKEEGKRLQELYYKMGYTKALSFYEFLTRTKDVGRQNNLKHYLCSIYLLAAVGLMFVSPIWGVLLGIVAIGYNLISYFAEKAKVEAYFTCLKYVVKMIGQAEEIERALSAKEMEDVFSDISKELIEEIKELKSMRRGMWLLMGNELSGSLSDMLMDYVRMMTHVDLIRFNQMLNMTIEKMQHINHMYALLGEVENTIAIASVREMLGTFCTPEFKAQGRGVSFEGIYHPLISQPVTNQLMEERYVLLTGSNASGKSTFLKSVALNMILAQTIYTCSAIKFEGGFYRVYSSMALRDDLESKESYYIVEIKSLKRIMDMSRKYNNIFCFVDEVLRGTNTVERIAASTEILKYMHTCGIMCFAATHDIELTGLLEDCYSNYHFTEEIVGEEVRFSYHLQEGKATTRNAIRLLEVIGYEKEVVAKAQERAAHFMEKGVWSKLY